MVKGPIKSQRFSRRQVRDAVIIIGCSLAVLVAGGGIWALYSKMATAEKKDAQAIRDKKARDIATQVHKNLTVTIDQLTVLAKAEETITLFEKGDDETLLTTAVEKQSLFDRVLVFRYIKPDVHHVFDENLISQLGWASVELLEKAKTKSNINVQAQLLRSSNELGIVLVKNVFDSAHELIGFLYLGLDNNLFEDLIKGIELKDGYIELVQHTAGKQKGLILEKAGNRNLRQGEATMAKVNATLWTIAYWSDSEMFMGFQPSLSSPIILIVLVLLLLGAALFFVIRKRRRDSLAEEFDMSITYGGAVRNIAEGAHSGTESLIPHLPNAKQMLASSKTATRKRAHDQDSKKQADSNHAPKKEPAAARTIDDKKSGGNDAPTTEEEPVSQQSEISSVIFRAYDIRGVVGETLTETAVHEIARAIGTKADTLGQQGIIVGRDGRNSSLELSEALIKGLRSTGRDVIDIGMVPTPVLYFATYHLETGNGVMITGSHNAPEYNGLKIMLAGNTLSGDEIKELQSLAMAGQHTTGQGDLRHADISADYIRRISEEFQIALSNSLNIVVDCGNGVAGALAPKLFKALGHDVIEMYCEIDGDFPNHHPDPSQPDNLQALIEKVKAENADVGFAFDGDGDRLGLIDAAGNIIWPDRQLMLLAQDVLSRNQGAPIIFDVKCSRHLKTVIETNGGKPLMWKTGHSLIKNKMKEVDAPLAGEMSGHIFFKERWYGFDDALYTAARFIEIFINAKKTTTELFSTFPKAVETPELRMPLAENKHAWFMKELAKKLSVKNAKIINIDGLRIEYPDAWGLARPSNTSPNIILRFEGDNEVAMKRVRSDFQAAIKTIKVKST